MIKEDHQVLKHPLKRDIYSYGMVCFEILTGRVPFSSVLNEKEVKSLVLQGKRPILPEDPQKCSLLLKELIESCWSSNPRKRPTFMDICSKLKYLKYLLMRSCKLLPIIFVAVYLRRICYEIVLFYV